MYVPEQTTFYPFEYDTVENWAYWDGAFSKTECDDLVKQIQSLGLEKSTVGMGIADTNLRNSTNKMLFPKDHFDLFQRITGIVKPLNNQFFKFDLFGMIEGVQFTEYTAPNGHFIHHIDKNFGGCIRKLSITVQLTDPSSYEGGDLELFLSDFDKPIKTPRTQGTLIAFPSYMLHRISPVKKGSRNSLVSWFTGNNFK